MIVLLPGAPLAFFHSRTAIATPLVCQYTITTGSDPIVPGTTDTGNHTDDGDTLVALPFPFPLYDQTYTTVNVNSNGRLDFVCSNEPEGYRSRCLPAPPNVCSFDYTIFVLWMNYLTFNESQGCSEFSGGCGIFTSVSGTAPNRIFNIEWRVVNSFDPFVPANFEVRLYENDPNKRFDIIFGAVNKGNDQSFVSGVQGADVLFTADLCSIYAPDPGSRTYTCVGGGTPTPTPTSIPRPTPTPRIAPTAKPRPNSGSAVRSSNSLHLTSR